MTTFFIFTLHLVASILLIVFMVLLPRFTRSIRRGVAWAVVLIALFLIVLSFIASLDLADPNRPLMFISFCLTPMSVVVLVIAAFYRATTPTADFTVNRWVWLLTPLGLVLMLSPAIGYFAPGAACNGIHRRQVEPVRQALLAYQEDSARFPLGIQALIPFYLEEKPTLLCFGNNHQYRLASCDRAVVLEMDDFYGLESHRLFLISGDWETSGDEPRSCQPME
jgi:hypothetical protein